MLQISKGMFGIFSTVFFGFAILIEGIAVFTGKAEFRFAWINFLIWVGVNLGCKLLRLRANFSEKSSGMNRVI